MVGSRYKIEKQKAGYYLRVKGTFWEVKERERVVKRNINKCSCLYMNERVRRRLTLKRRCNDIRKKKKNRTTPEG